MLKVIGHLLCVVGKWLGGRGISGGGSQVILPTAIRPAKTIKLVEASSILLDVAEAMGDDKAELYLPDSDIKVYYPDEVRDYYKLDEVSAITYVKEVMDCDDFAAILYGAFAGLCWTNLHALNWFIDEDSTFWWIEPQTGKLSRSLEGWQGNDVRFFLGR